MQTCSSLTRPQSFEAAILDALLSHETRRSLAQQSWLASIASKERAELADLERIRKLEIALSWQRVDIARFALFLDRLIA
jgi:hypothetical protein